MRSIESEGDSIDEAIDNALRALQVGRDQVEIEILENASRGLLGFGGRRARVRATVRPPLSRALAEVDGRSAGGIADGSGVSVSGETVASAETGDRRIRARAYEDALEARGETPEARSPSDFEARAKTLLGELIARLGVSCTIEVLGADDPGDDPGIVALAVIGDSSGLLIGRRGQTLDAIEYLVNRILAKDLDGGAGRVVIDVEGYRDRRRTSLEALAHRLAEKAKQSGRAVTLNPLSPRDRRIVHLALQQDGAVSTRSQGEGYYRKLLILPAERGRRSARPSEPAT